MRHLLRRHMRYARLYVFLHNSSRHRCGNWCWARRCINRLLGYVTGTSLLTQNGLVQHSREFIPIRTPRLLYLRGNLCHMRSMALRRMHDWYSLYLSEITQAPLQFFNALTQRPFEALCICHARLETHTAVISLTQEALEFCHVRAEPLDNCICGLLQFFFQFINGRRKILIILLAPLPAMKDIPHDEQKDSAEDDECAQNFGDGYNNRMPPLSVLS